MRLSNARRAHHRRLDLVADIHPSRHPYHAAFTGIVLTFGHYVKATSQGQFDTAQQ
jgi:hypothetical protein